MGEKSMLKHSWIVEQKASTATLILSKPMTFHYYCCKIPFTHEMLMEQSIQREQFAMP